MTSAGLNPGGQFCTPQSLSGRPIAYRIVLDGNSEFNRVLWGLLGIPTDETTWLECESSDVSETLTAIAWTKGFLTLEVDVAQIGAIIATAAATIPQYALLCDGSTRLRVDYPELYAVLDAAFIVDADHFRVPDLQSRVPLGAGHGGGLSSYAVGDVGGEESHALSGAENGTHSHTIPGTISSLAVQPGDLPVLDPFIIPGGTGDSGSGTPHENRQPYLALRYYIVTA